MIYHIIIILTYVTNESMTIVLCDDSLVESHVEPYYINPVPPYVYRVILMRDTLLLYMYVT